MREESLVLLLTDSFNWRLRALSASDCLLISACLFVLKRRRLLVLVEPEASEEDEELEVDCSLGWEDA